MKRKSVIFALAAFCFGSNLAFGQQGNVSQDQLRADWNLLPKVVQQMPRIPYAYNDYFSPSVNLGLLQNVEAAHFSADNFFLKYKAQQFEYALEELKYSLFMFPNHPKVLMMVESIARLTKNRALPLPYYERALKLFPQRAFTHYQYGEYLLELGHDDAAIKSLQNAISIDPKLAVAHAALARAYSKKGELDLAKESAGKAIELGYTEDLMKEIAKKAPLQ